MKKRSLLIIPAIAALGTAFLIAPEKPSRSKAAPFYGRNIAHRGLHTKDGVTPENSIPAFSAAAALGYGAELDVHLTLDNKVVVFHDDDLSRMCGDSRKIEDLLYTELKQLRLGDTDLKIPLLSEVLPVLNGAPVILEIKRGRRNNLLRSLALSQIRAYPGPVCVESFDPTIVRWFRKNAPEYLRGQLACPTEDVKGVPKIAAFALSHLLTNAYSRPNFVAYKIGKKPLTVKLCEKMGAMKVAWTSQSAANERKNDTVIFENYLPAVRFK